MGLPIFILWYNYSKEGGEIMKNEELTYEEIIGKIVNSKVFNEYYVDPAKLFDYSIYDREDYSPHMQESENRKPYIRAVVIMGSHGSEFTDELGSSFYISNRKTIQDCLWWPIEDVKGYQ